MAAAESQRDQDQPASRLSPERVEEFYRAFSADVLAFLWGIVRNKELAEELLQITFRRVLESGHTARPETMRGWIFKVAYHEAMLAKRQQATYTRNLRNFHDSRQFSTADGQHATPPNDAWQQLVQREDVMRLRAALLHLPPEQRQVLERRITQQQTFAEIAAELKLPLGTVLTRMRLALGKLQSHLQDQPPRPN